MVARKTPARKAPARKTPARAPAKRAPKAEVIDMNDKPASKRGKKTADDAPVFNSSMLYDGVLDAVSKLVGDSDNMESCTPLHSGSLVHDIVLGGGYKPAMYTNAGWEQTGKTTDQLHGMAESIVADVDVIAFFDAEGSTKSSLDYVARILQQAGVRMTKDQLFGKWVDGKQVQKGRVYYRSLTRGNLFFNWLAGVLNRAPDKLEVGGKWYLKFPNDKAHAHLKQHHDETTKKKDGIYIRAKNGGLAGIVFVDSWAALNPDSKDEDDVNNALGSQARMFSAGLKRVKGLLASKKFAIVGTNRLSEIPMAITGPKEKEVGGNALRYDSDARTRFTARSLSGAPLWPVESKKKKGYEVERAVGGGVDAYQYKHIKTSKNKLGTAGREGWLRIWVRDSNGKGRGIDPVFDTIMYLYMTGQVLAGGQKARQKMVLNLDKHGKSKKTITWDELKLWILGTREDATRICKAQGIAKPFPLRAWCKKQMLSGRGEELYSIADGAASEVPKAEADSNSGDEE